MSTTTTLKCKQCKGPLEYEEGSSLLRCPQCGYTEMIDESDELKLERIRAKNQKDIEVEKARIENEANVEKKRLYVEQERIGLGKMKAAIVLVLIAVIVGGGAFIGINASHKGKIQVEDATTYVGKNYEQVQKVFQSGGFENVELNRLETLTKSDAQQVSNVSEVSIDGRSDFKNGSWYAKDANIIITYLALDPARENDIQLLKNATDYLKLDIAKVCDEFKRLGFEQITIVPINDTIIDTLKNSEVTSITIENREFTGGEWYAPDADIRITYRTKEFDYVGNDYSEVQAFLKELGFEQVEVSSLDDLDPEEMKKKSGKVTSVTIGDDGEKEFSSAKEYTLSEPVVVYYHSGKKADVNQIEISVASKKLEGKDYNEVVETLKEQGFTNVQVVAKGDLKKGLPDILKKENAVDEVSIAGLSVFKEGKVFNKDDAVIVYYHSYKPEENVEDVELGENEARITVSSKDLIKLTYQEVVDKLEGLGFTNIKTEALGDLKKGWIHHEGDVDEISINGVKKFSATDIFNKNAEIVVTYHSYPQ